MPAGPELPPLNPFAAELRRAAPTAVSRSNIGSGWSVLLSRDSVCPSVPELNTRVVGQVAGSSGVELGGLGATGAGMLAGIAAAGYWLIAAGGGPFMIAISEAITAIDAAPSSETAITNGPADARLPLQG